MAAILRGSRGKWWRLAMNPTTLHVTLVPAMPISLLHPLQVFRSEFILLHRGVFPLLTLTFILLRPPVNRWRLQSVLFISSSRRQRLILQRVAGTPISADIFLLFDRKVADFGYWLLFCHGHFNLLRLKVGREGGVATVEGWLVVGGVLPVCVAILDGFIEGWVDLGEGALGRVLAIREDRMVVQTLLSTLHVSTLIIQLILPRELRGHHLHWLLLI